MLNKCYFNQTKQQFLLQLMYSCMALQLFEAIGSKILSLDKLFPTPRNSKSQNFEAGAFHSHISYLWREIAKNLNHSSENRAFLYLKPPSMTFIEPNMDEGCRIVHKFNETPSQDFSWLTSSIVSCKCFKIKIQII